MRCRNCYCWPASVGALCEECATPKAGRTMYEQARKMQAEAADCDLRVALQVMRERAQAGAA